MAKQATEEAQAQDTLLNAARKAAGLSYAELGRALGVERAAARRYCEGLRTPKRGRDGEEGPAEKLARWSGGRINILNFDAPAKPAAAKRRR
jgi:transcriptional regulator with XRE-family HTH domain